MFNKTQIPEEYIGHSRVKFLSNSAAIDKHIWSPRYKLVELEHTSITKSKTLSNFKQVSENKYSLRCLQTHQTTRA